MTTIALTVPDELLDQLADKITERTHIGGRDSTDSVSPWMTVPDAAAYLRCSKHALYRLTATKAIPFRKKQGGQALLFHRDELDQWVESAYSREGVPV